MEKQDEKRDGVFSDSTSSRAPVSCLTSDMSGLLAFVLHSKHLDRAAALYCKALLDQRVTTGRVGSRRDSAISGLVLGFNRLRYEWVRTKTAAKDEFRQSLFHCAKPPYA